MKPLASIANVLPLVERELRAESRRPANYWLRVLAAAVMVGTLLGFALRTDIAVSHLGGRLFHVIHRTLLLAIWVVVPLMTADCISREKREGTLGLLFLTPLGVLDVLLGKAAINILRAATLVLAALPMAVLPLVLGGVEWQQVVRAMAMVANALLLGIAAGLYASARGGSTIQVMVWAEFYALCIAMLSLICYFFVFAFSPRSWVGLAFELGWFAFFSIMTFVLVVKLGVEMLRETWDKDSAAVEQPKWVETFSSSEFWRGVFRWDRGHALDQNPIAWLQEYSWTARLTKWGWFLCLLWAEFFIVLPFFPGCQPQLITALSLGVAFSAAGSFRRERQTGMLEILLVTPLSERQLAGGRLWGIFCHFSPALAVLAVFWYADRILNERAFNANAFSFLFPNPASFLAVMALGLYLSLWRLNFLAGWLVTWILAFLLPAAAASTLGRSLGLSPKGIITLTSILQIVLALISWFLLQHNMRDRKFAAARGAG